MPVATVIGAGGFVGSALANRLEGQGSSVFRVGRGDELPAELGHVFYCAGLTADFRTRLHDTIAAHVTLVNEILRSAQFDSFTYLSSTRVYQRSQTGAEDSALVVDPRDPGDVYNLSKLTGEAICLADPRHEVRAVRLSNVFGPGDQSDNFLNAVVGEAKATGAVTIVAGRNAGKDYISLDDAVEAIARVPLRATSRLLNVAGGASVTNGEVGELLERELGATVGFGDGGGTTFPNVCNRRMREELGVDPTPFDLSFPEFLRNLS